MRFLGVALALAFGLATMGPEAHQCPVHDQHGPGAPPAAHHRSSTPDHQQAPQKHCTCPQACCAAGVGVSMPAMSSRFVAASLAVVFGGVDAPHVLLLPSRDHALPFALAPPIRLA